MLSEPITYLSLNQSSGYEKCAFARAEQMLDWLLKSHLDNYKRSSPGTTRGGRFGGTSLNQVAISTCAIIDLMDIF